MTRDLIKPQGFDSENDTVYLYDLKRRREVELSIKMINCNGTIQYPGEMLAVLGWAILVLEKDGHQAVFLVQSKNLEQGLYFPTEVIEKGKVWPVEYESQVT